MRDGSGDEIRGANAAPRRLRSASLRSRLTLMTCVVGLCAVAAQAQSPDPASNDTPPPQQDPSPKTPPTPPKDPGAKSPPDTPGKGPGKDGKDGGGKGGSTQPPTPDRPPHGKPPETRKPDATPRPGQPASGEPLQAADVRLPWVESRDGGGNATMVRDVASGATFLVTTIDALGFRSGERSVELHLYEASGDAAAGRAKFARKATEAVDSYGFRVLPAGHPLAGLCVHRLSERAAEELVRDGTLCFLYDSRAIADGGGDERVLGEPDAPNAKTRHLVRDGIGMRWRFVGANAQMGAESSTIDPPLPGTEARGAPLFAVADLADGQRVEIVDALLGTLDSGARGEVGVVRPWGALLELLDEARTVPIDDARALLDFLPRHWEHAKGYRDMVEWARLHRFTTVAHWRMVKLDPTSGSASFPYAAPHLQAGARPDPRLICAVSDKAGDDVTIKLESGQLFGVEEHPVPDAAVALRDAHQSSSLMVGILATAGPGRSPTNVLVLEAATAVGGRPLGDIPESGRD